MSELALCVCVCVPGLRTQDLLLHSGHQATAGAALPGRGHGCGPDPCNGLNTHAAVGAPLQQEVPAVAIQKRHRFTNSSTRRTCCSPPELLISSQILERLPWKIHRVLGPVPRAPSALLSHWFIWASYIVSGGFSRDIKSLTPSEEEQHW